VACDVSTNRAGGLIIHLAYRSLTQVDVTGEPVEEYRPVLFDAAGRRRVLKAKAPGEWQPLLLLWPHSEGVGLAGSSNDAGIFRFEVPPVGWPGPSPDPHVALIGVERLAPSTLRGARLASFLATMRRLERAEYTQVSLEGLGDPYSWVTCPHVGIVWPSGLLREPFVGRDLPGNTEFRHGARLGAFEVLRRDRGETGAAPKAMRDAQIARFVRLMAEFERVYGPLVPNRVETPFLDAYEILRRRAARSSRHDPDLEAARSGADY
jgi:hypothetical protein